VVARIGEDMPQEYVSDPCPAYTYDMAGFRVPLQPLNFEPNFGITAQQNILQAFRQNYANEETYYFHGNHLGSANWVTLQNASPTQFLLHLPYGEEFVKQLNGSYDERFTFTGKEKDIETGYYYFGARFDNVDLGFMSVDPMSDKYPSISPYAYCAWNPIKLVDPDGRDALVIVDEEKKLITIKANIIFYAYGKRVGTNDLKKTAENYKQNIIDNWSKDNNGNPWTIEHDGNTYTIIFKINVNVDNDAGRERYQKYNGMNNYIGIGRTKSEVNDNHRNRGIWEIANSSNNAGAHEFGHLLGLKDRYIKIKDELGYSHSKPEQGWENNIMGVYGGKIEQRNIDAIFNSVLQNKNNTKGMKRPMGGGYIFILNNNNKER